jgi:hypothetical protein
MSLLGKSKENKTRLFSGLFLENPARYLLQSVRGLTFFRNFRDMPLVDTAAIDDDAVSMLAELTKGPWSPSGSPLFGCPLVLSQPPIL